MKRLVLSLVLFAVLFGCGQSTDVPRAAGRSAGTGPPPRDDGTPSASSDGTPQITLEKLGRGDAISLRLDPPTSANWTYRTNVETTQSGAASYTLNTQMEQAVAIKEVPGGAEVSITITDVSMRAKEKEIQRQMDEMARMMKGIQTVAVYDARGFTKGATSTGGAGVPAMIAAAQAEVPVGLFGLLFPDKPVAVGAEWIGHYNMEKVLQSMARASGTSARVLKGAFHPVRYRLEDVRTAGGRKVAIISFTLAGDTEAELTVRAMSPSGGGQTAKVLTKSSINGKGTAQVDVETGVPIRVEMEQRSTAETQGTKTETAMKSVMQRLG